MWNKPPPPAGAVTESRGQPAPANLSDDTFFETWTSGEDRRLADLPRITQVERADGR
ncbi:hypothetical protein Vau01_016230 [Virgisporangium aurantiacum]|uniref:Uncharacterized protein n=1 Tax=Virgisporangium aurantiacum TaxID=175570 RepID=A0A8J3Z0C5_9ACTN|nr:hypothetical protein Vau01_016230 [Virgisporangium aurantiacum]